MDFHENVRYDTMNNLELFSKFANNSLDTWMEYFFYFLHPCELETPIKNRWMGFQKSCYCTHKISYNGVKAVLCSRDWIIKHPAAIDNHWYAFLFLDHKYSRQYVLQINLSDAHWSGADTDTLLYYATVSEMKCRLHFNQSRNVMNFSASFN